MRSFLLVLAIVLIPPSAVQAELLQDAVRTMLKHHDRVKAAHADVAAGKSRIDEAFGTNWYPQLATTAFYGREKIMHKPLAANSDLFTRELDLSVTQKVYDFGTAQAAIEATASQYKQLNSTLALTRQGLIFEAINAYYNLLRAMNTLKWAQESENNIKRQAELEDIRVQRGQGYSTDLLQAKAQLAGAEARRIQMEGALIQAQNRVRTVFMRSPEEILALKVNKIPWNALPKTLNEAIRSAMEHNHQLKGAAHLVDTNREVVKSTLSSNFFPTINAVVEQKFKENVSGVDGYTKETLAKMELSYPLNLGLTGLDSVTAAKQDLAAARGRLNDTKRQVEEAVRNAWQALKTTRDNAKMLHHQADIAEQFLEMARKERKLGNRSLLDLLSGETAWINARSDAESADVDHLIALFNLLQSMGQLTLEMVP
ncbi:TolC family protein [Magnetococcales bacterium HHB-1]